MKHRMHHFMISVLMAAATGAALIFTACTRIPEKSDRINMTSLSPRLQPLFEKTKTVCFGRFVMSVPTSATVVFGPAEVEYPIEHFARESGNISKRVAERLILVEEDRRFLLDGDIDRLPLFGKVIDGTFPGQKFVFGSKDQVSYSVYSYVPIGGDLFVQTIDGALSKDAEIRSLVSNLEKIASHLRLRAADDIPTEQGTCIDGGFVPLNLEFERVTVGVRLKEFPDVHFSVDVHKNQNRLDESGSAELMLQRAEEQAKKQGLGYVYARIKSFRRGTRQLGSWEGFEIVARKPVYMDDTDAHEFRFQSLGSVNDPLLPQLDVRLDSGVKNDRKTSVRPGITDEEAIALWDRLIGTIRVRETNDAKFNKPVHAKIPLASLVVTGATCPQTGWWQCTEGDNIDGGRRRHFTVGDLMPHAILIGEPNLWQKLTGERPRHEMATIWKLVDYSVEPAAPPPKADKPAPLAALAPPPPLPEADATKDAPPSMS